MSEPKKKTVKKKPEKAAAPKKAIKKKVAPAEAAIVEEVKPIEAAPVEVKEEVKAEPVKMEHKAEHPPVVHHHHKPKKSKGAAIKQNYGTGRRKTATARAWLVSGSGKVSVNELPAEEFFCKREVLIKSYKEPFAITNTLGKYDVRSFVRGGGVSAQADALKMAIARALAVAEPELRKTLRVNDILKRDPREKERKKYGLKRARRAFQFTKR